MTEVIGEGKYAVATRSRIGSSRKKKKKKIKTALISFLQLCIATSSSNCFSYSTAATLATAIPAYSLFKVSKGWMDLPWFNKPTALDTLEEGTLTSYFQSQELSVCKPRYLDVSTTLIHDA